MPVKQKLSLEDVGAMITAFCALSDKIESYALHLSDMLLVALGDEPPYEMDEFKATTIAELFDGVDDQTKADRLFEYLQASPAFFLVDLGPNGRNVLKPSIEEPPCPASGQFTI